MVNNILSVALETKSINEDGTFSGYGSIFNNADSDGDRVQRGAFTKSIEKWQAKGKLPPLLWQHEMKNPIGKYTVMREDNAGLYVEGKILLDVQQGREAYSLLKEGVVTGLSIGYMTRESEYDAQLQSRMLKELDLMEVSLVTFPSNEAAGVLFVKAASQVNTPRKFERFLKNAGFTQTQAKAITAKGFSQRDVDIKPLDDARDAQIKADMLGALLALKSTIHKGIK